MTTSGSDQLKPLSAGRQHERVRSRTITCSRFTTESPKEVLKKFSIVRSRVCGKFTKRHVSRNEGFDG
jgi:hypothetical protein